MRTLNTSLATVMGALALLGALALGSCDDGTRSAACQTVCTRYHDCFDVNYDQAQCQTRCRDSSANDVMFQNQVDHCEACIENRACTEAGVRCAGECAGIVP